MAMRQGEKARPRERADYIQETNWTGIPEHMNTRQNRYCREGMPKNKVGPWNDAEY